MSKTIILFSMLFLIGCASAPTAEELLNADYRPLITANVSVKSGSGII